MIQSLRDQASELQEQKETLIDAAEAVAFGVVWGEAEDLKDAGEYMRQCPIDKRWNDEQCQMFRAIGEFYLAAASQNSFRPR
jgi:hypothetical protein